MLSVLAFLRSTIGKYLLAIGVALGVLLRVYVLGRKHEEDKQKAEDQQDFIDTTDRINDVEDSPDRDAALDRLRDSGDVR